MPKDEHPGEVTFSHAGVSLAGLLAVPDADAPSPGVVMVGGSGSTDRNNDIYFPPIRGHLVNAGIAVLSYDKRGVGGSSGDWRDATLDDLATDAGAALDFLRAQPGVRAEAVGLFGHSEGGWVVLRAATGRDDVPWVITNSCPGTTPAVQERHALRHADDATLAVYDRLCEAGRRDAELTETARIVRSAPSPHVFGDYWDETDERLWRFTKRKQDHDPIPNALGLRCPHLAVFGAADELVPVADSVHLFSTAACHPGRHPGATLSIELFPHADHRIRTTGTTRLAAGYLPTLTRWIRGHVTR
jgi:pimeloyl-ACP methyl ester carboxylesterase